ncbi:MAG: hypothetical protein EBR83_06795 [Verrucomicrobia bacterium]|jgi:uncharacterized protein (TIGR02001 family)|nr:TorF family putative porin [Opitutales bacterium]NBV53211.1 hypothetical protein [Verrucomicrobiota bacterium]
MKHTSITLLTLTAAASIAQAAPATPAYTTSGNVAISSDYVFRGLSQTAGKTAVSAGYDVSHSSGLSAGIWASNVSSALGSLEIDLYAAYGFKVGAVDVSVGYINYTYNTAANGGEANVSATYAGLNLKVSKGVNGTLSDYYYEANYSYDIAQIKGLNLGLHYGNDRASKKDDYAIALNYPVLGFTGSVSYSDIEKGKSITAVSLKKTF